MAEAFHACYIIGEPGAGKTTLAEHLTRGLPFEEHGDPFAYRRYDAGPLELGKRREGGFSGTDALSMSVQPTVTRWLWDVRPRLVFAEGDRLANDKFFNSLQEMGYAVHVYQLWGARVAAEQRAARGSNQDPTWLRGRQSKVTGLRQRWNGTVLPAGADLDELEGRMDDPVVMALRTAREAQEVMFT